MTRHDQITSTKSRLFGKVSAGASFQIAYHTEVGQISQHKRVYQDLSGGMASRLPAIRAKSVEKTHLIVSGTHSYFAPEVWPRDRQAEPVH